jgi:hypothetical protein
MPTNAPAMMSLRKWKFPAIKTAEMVARLAAQSALSVGRYVQRITAMAQTGAVT